MMALRLFACYFGSQPGEPWERLARVLAATAARHCAGWTVQVRRLAPRPMVSALGSALAVANSQKLEEWTRVVDAAPDGERLLLLDADTMILRGLDDVWHQPFDIAYTTKQSHFPFNLGVLFLRVSDRTRTFLRVWHAENMRMLGDRSYHIPWRTKYGGINQAAFGAMLARHADDGLALAKLPCTEWNCEDSSWATFDPDKTRIVHCKSSLRRAIFGQEKPSKITTPIVEYWHALEAQASVRRSA